MEQAKGELVPGGLAMVYGLVVDVELNGIFCETVRLADLEDCDEYEPGDWVCNCHGEQMVFGRANLMPINPEADPLHTEETKCQTA